MSTRVAGYLSDKCVSKLVTWKEQGNRNDFRNLNSSYSLKYSVIHNSLVHLEITSSTSFEIYETDTFGEKIIGSIISESLVFDFLSGSRRVKSQYENLIKSKNSGVNAAWLLVTAYYCAFFSAIEISRLFGKISLHLEYDELQEIRRRTAATAESERFFENSPRNFTGNIEGNRIVFQSSGDRPHQAAWSNLNKVLISVFKDKGWIDAESLCAIVSGRRTPNPSTIRNEWNYRHSDRFGERGQRIGYTFLKLLGNKSSASSWLSNADGLRQDDEAVAASIAALCEAASSAVIDTRARVIDTDILEA
jgi:hypothetical protein